MQLNVAPQKQPEHMCARPAGRGRWMVDVAEKRRGLFPNPLSVKSVNRELS